MAERIEGTTLVVGAASTIGTEIVRHLDNKTEKLSLSWHKNEPEVSEGQKSFQVDLTSYDSISELLEELRHATPMWRNIVYVAGDYWADQGNTFGSKDEWERASKLFQVNATAFTVLVRELHELMRSQDLRGKVVAVSSTSADHGYTGAPIYAASKAALNRLVIDAATRYGKNLSVSAVAPGPVDTPLLSTTPRGGKDEYVKETPTGKLSTPEDIAKAVVFLLENPQVSGVVLAVDGGRIVS